jgi:hypothetical protein
VAHVTPEVDANREIHPAEPAGWGRVGAPGIVAHAMTGKAKEIYPSPLCFS